MRNMEDKTALVAEDNSEHYEKYAALLSGMGLRVERARRLLDTTDYEISQIAYQTGFSSQSHFQNVFKHMTGETPREWRTREIHEI